MSVFNSPLELGTRMAFLLLALYPRRADLQRLVFLDYAVIYSADLGGPPSLHTPIPLRGAEYASRRQVIEDGLYLMAMKSVVEVIADGNGVHYCASERAAGFSGFFHGKYIAALMDRCEWVARKFGDASDAELARLFFNEGHQWGSELLAREPAGAIE
jgi:hypothetical protein